MCLRFTLFLVFTLLAWGYLTICYSRSMTGLNITQKFYEPLECREEHQTCYTFPVENRVDVEPEVFWFSGFGEDPAIWSKAFEAVATHL